MWKLRKNLVRTPLAGPRDLHGMGASLVGPLRAPTKKVSLMCKTALTMMIEVARSSKGSDHEPD